MKLRDFLLSLVSDFDLKGNFSNVVNSARDVVRNDIRKATHEIKEEISGSKKVLFRSEMILLI